MHITLKVIHLEIATNNIEVETRSFKFVIHASDGQHPFSVTNTNELIFGVV